MNQTAGHYYLPLVSFISLGRVGDIIDVCQRYRWVRSWKALHLQLLSFPYPTGSVLQKVEI